MKQGPTLELLARRLNEFATLLRPREREALDVLLQFASGNEPLDALAAEQAEGVLEPHEVELFHTLAAEPPSKVEGLRPSLVIVMKATRLCNLRCTYCHFWRDGRNQIMPFEVLARATRDALRAPGVRVVEFVWHGGEATLLPLAFYHKALWLQQQFRQPEQAVRNALQTNGTRLSDEWIEFCRRYEFSLGVSLDGPPEVHDKRRIDIAGRPTSARVRAALQRIGDAGLDHGVLMVVDEDVVELGAARVLEYLLEIGVREVGLLNVVPNNTPPGAPLAGSYLSWPRYVVFLRELFQLWWPAHADRVVLRELADLLGKVSGEPSRTCFFAGDCIGGFLTVEPNGEVSACDKYIGDDSYRFGDLSTMNLAEIAASPRLASLRAENNRAVEQTRVCEWFNVCQAGCPHDRYTRDRHLHGYDERCCGLAPLLAEMAALGRHLLPVPPTKPEQDVTASSSSIVA